MTQHALLSNSAFASLSLFPSVPSHLPPRSTPSQRPMSRSTINPRPLPAIPSRQSSLSTPTGLSTVASGDDQQDLASLYSHNMLAAQQAPPRTPSPSGRAFDIVLDSPPATSVRSARSWSANSLRGLRSVSVMDFGSPCAITAEEKAVSRPGNVFLSKQKLTNWARPLKGDEKDDVHIFGQSLQRTRRLNKHVRSSSADVVLPSPSPSSSDDERLPVTPSAELDLSSRSWTTPRGLIGLGVKGVEGLEALSLGSSPLASIEEAVARKSSVQVVDISTSPAASSIELGSPLMFPCGPASSSTRREATAPPRLVSTFQSLNALGSPGSLAELRELQKAAIELEVAARQPFKLTMPLEQDKRIRRKAVPTVFEEPMEEVKLGSPSKPNALRRKAVPVYLDQSDSPKLPLSASKFTLTVAQPVQIARSDSNTSTSSNYQADRSESSSINSSPRTPASTTPHTTILLDTARPTPKRSFYANAKATMSMFDVSPRLHSSPIALPPRMAAKTPGHARSASQPTPASPTAMERKSSGSGYSSSGDSWDMPMTPGSFTSATCGDDIKVRVGGNGFLFPPAPAKKKSAGIYGNKSAFISQLDLGLRKVLDRKESDGASKHRRGFSRFFGLKA